MFATITADDVRRIRKLATKGVATRILAEKYKLSQGMVREIITRRKWASVE